MKFEEIRRYVNVSRAHSIGVDARDVHGLSGWMRLVTICWPAMIRIEYLTAEDYLNCNLTGGLRYIGQYATLEAAVDDLQIFLGTNIESWRNYTSEPHEPTQVRELQPDANTRFLIAAVHERTLELPTGTSYRQGDFYWRQIEAFGEFRPDEFAPEPWDDRDEEALEQNPE